jgi:hypothetical protein
VVAARSDCNRCGPAFLRAHWLRSVPFCDGSCFVYVSTCSNPRVRWETDFARARDLDAVARTLYRDHDVLLYVKTDFSESARATTADERPPTTRPRRRTRPCDSFWLADGFGVVFGAREALFSPTRKRCRRAVFLAGPSRMVMPTCARPFRAPKTTRVSSRKGRFGAGFPLGIGRTPSDRCNTLTTGRESLLGPSLGVPAGAYQFSTIETTIVARTGRRRPPLPA